MTVPETSITGGQSFPLAAGAAGSALSDPVALGLIDYFAHWLNVSLNTKLAAMVGQPAVAVPAGADNRFSYNPEGFWVRNQAPAMYVWWKNTTMRPWSTVKDQSVSTYGFFYVFTRQEAPGGSEHVAGLLATVRRVLQTANDRGRHPTYGTPAGTPLFLLLGVAGWSFTRLTAGAMSPIPQTSSNVGGAGEGGVVDYYPAIEGDIEVLEVVGQPIPRVPEDVLVDSTFSIRTNESGDTTDVVEILDRVLTGPDGS